MALPACQSCQQGAVRQCRQRRRTQSEFFEGLSTPLKVRPRVAHKEGAQVYKCASAVVHQCHSLSLLLLPLFSPRSCPMVVVLPRRWRVGSQPNEKEAEEAADPPLLLPLLLLLHQPRHRALVEAKVMGAPKCVIWEHPRAGSTMRRSGDGWLGGRLILPSQCRAGVASSRASCLRKISSMLRRHL